MNQDRHDRYFWTVTDRRGRFCKFYGETYINKDGIRLARVIPVGGHGIWRPMSELTIDSWHKSHAWNEEQSRKFGLHEVPV